MGKLVLAKLVLTREDINRAPFVEKTLIRNSYVFEPKHHATKANVKRLGSQPEQIGVPPFYCYKMQNVSLIGPYGIAVTRRGLIVGEIFQSALEKRLRHTINQLGLARFIKLYLAALMPFRKATKNSIFHMVPRHGYGVDQPNFCHWLLENLPQLTALRKCGDGQTAILTNKTLTSFQIQSLELCGVLDSSVMRATQDFLRIDNFYFATLRSAASSLGERDPVGRRGLVSLLKKNIRNRKGSSDEKKVFLTRQHMETRVISNISQLETLFEKYGIETFDPGKHDFEYCVNFFRQAKLIVAPHGAALANMVFAESCTIVEMLCGEKEKADFFYYTAMEFGLKYETFLCNRDCEFERENDKIQEAWSVDIDLFEEMLIKLCQTQDTDD